MSINWKSVQSRLAAARLYTGPISGALGPLTMAAVLRHMGAPSAMASSLAQPLVDDLGEFGITSTRLRLAHWLGQNAHESGGFRSLEENLNYSVAAMRRVWPSRFPTEAAARPFANNPRALADRVYGGRMGNDSPGDGWLYRGRGIKMITGADNYAEMARITGLPLVANPDLAAQPVHASRISALFWSRRGCNALADADNIRGLTQRINGGLIGLADRQVRTRRALELLS